MKTTQVEWLTQEAAAERLGLSVRRTMDFAEAGQIQTKREVNEETGRPRTMLHAGDLEKLIYERASEKASSRVRALSTVDAPRAERARALLAAAGEVAESQPARPQFRPHEWLSVAEAAEYARLPESEILLAIERRELRRRNVGVRQGGRYRVKCADLAELVGRLEGVEEPAKAASV